MHTLHLLALVAWIGGLIYLNMVLFPSLSVIDMTSRSKLALQIIPKFLKLVWGSIGILLLTGLHRAMAVQGMTTMDAWTGNGYGHILMTKGLLFICLIGIAIHLTTVSYPKIKHHLSSPNHPSDPSECCSVCGELMLKTRKMLRIALIIGVIIIILAAKLRVG